MLFPTLLAMLCAQPPAVASGTHPVPAAGQPVQAAPLSQWPMRQGAKWIYEGDAEWTAKNQVQSGPLREVMEVLRFLPGPDGDFAAVVKGLPLDLAWYLPGKKPKLSILIGRKGRLFQRPASELRPALIEARILLADPVFPSRSEDPFLDLPLQPGKSWGSGVGRADAMYCWVVDGHEPKPFSAPLVAKGAPFQVFTASFTTNPDHTVIDFAPGLGITAFSYEHHGTVARTQVHLVAWKPAGGGGHNP